MSWRVVVYGLAGIGAWVLTSFTAAVAYIALVEWRTRHQDRPSRRDDTWRRFERSEWTNQEEGR